MGSFSAQILVGSPCIYHGGISPSHYMFLWENSVPTWNLVRENIFQAPGESNNRILWVPSAAEHILEDALLMIAFYVVKDPDVVRIAKGAVKDINSSSVQLHESLDKKTREVLISRCRAIENWPKLVITGMSGSSVNHQVSILKEYKLDVEICLTNQKM